MARFARLNTLLLVLLVSVVKLVSDSPALKREGLLMCGETGESDGEEGWRLRSADRIWVDLWHAAAPSLRRAVLDLLAPFQHLHRR